MSVCHVVAHFLLSTIVINFVSTMPTQTCICFQCLTCALHTLTGPNKVVVLISNYSVPLNQTEQERSPLIHTALRTRLYNQEPLRVYLDQDHVLSWSDSPNQSQAKRLVELANLDPNPQNTTCCVL